MSGRVLRRVVAGAGEPAVDDLAAVITGLTAWPCVLAGHSWGGLLAQATPAGC